MLFLNLMNKYLFVDIFVFFFLWKIELKCKQFSAIPWENIKIHNKNKGKKMRTIKKYHWKNASILRDSIWMYTGDNKFRRHGIFIVIPPSNYGTNAHKIAYHNLSICWIRTNLSNRHVEFILNIFQFQLNDFDLENEKKNCETRKQNKKKTITIATQPPSSLPLHNSYIRLSTEKKTIYFTNVILFLEKSNPLATDRKKIVSLQIQ